MFVIPIGARFLPPLIVRLRDRLSSAHPDHKRIARNAIWVSLFVLVGKCAGALKEMSIAYRYGISGVVDAYQLTLTLTTWLPAVLVSVMSVVLIPTMVRLGKKDEDQRKLFIAELQGIALLLGLGFVTAYYLSWNAVLDVMARNLSAPTRTMSRQLMYGMAPISLFVLLIGVYGARLQAREKHVNTLLECIPSASLLTWVLLAREGRSLIPLMWGTLAGFLLQTVCLGIFAKRADGSGLTPKLSFRSVQWPHMYRSVGVFIAGQLVMSLVTPLDQYAVGHIGDGAIATLGYANRVLALMLSMGALAISRATLPVLSGILDKGEFARARDTALQWSALMFVVGLIVVAISWVLAPRGIALLFQRGAFTEQDTVVVSTLFRWGLVQLPFYFSSLVLVQLFASEGRFPFMAAVAVANFVIKALANLVFIRWLGMAGILLATGLMYACSCICFAMVARRLK